MSKFKAHLLLAAAFSGLLAFPVSQANASAATDKIIGDFYFSSLSTEATLFNTSDLNAAAQALRVELNKGVTRFGAYGYTDKRCNPDNYTFLPNPCQVVNRVTRGNSFLSKQRATTLRDRINSRLTAAERARFTWEVVGHGERHAEASVNQCRTNPDGNPCKWDRHAAVVIPLGFTPPPSTAPTQSSVPPSPPPPPVRYAPTAIDDSYVWTYGQTYQNNVGINDTCSDSPCSYSLVSQPSSGSVSVASNGAFSYTPVQYFTGNVSFRYRVTSTYGQTADATALITINAPAMPAIPQLVSTASLTAPAWARLNFNEKFVTRSAMSCTTGSATATRCTTDLGVVGSYIEIESIAVSGMLLMRPSGYPSSRYKVVTDPTGAVVPATGVLRFSQATTALAKFELRVSVTTTLREVQFRRGIDGRIVEVSSSSAVRIQPVSTRIGVIGSTL
jgi:hypothetical protein